LKVEFVAIEAESGTSAASDSFVAVDEDWKIMFANNSDSMKLVARVAGLGRSEDFIGKDYWDVFFMYKGTISESNIRAAMEKREIRRWNIRSKNSGRIHECVAYPAKNGIGVWAVDVDSRRDSQSSMQK